MSPILIYMNYAVRRLTEELQDQLLIQESFEAKSVKSESIEKVLTITARRIEELRAALTVLQPFISLEDHFPSKTQFDTR